MIHQRTQSCIPIRKIISSSYDIVKSIQNKQNDKMKREYIAKRRIEYTNDMKTKDNNNSHKILKVIEESFYFLLYLLISPGL